MPRRNVVAPLTFFAMVAGAYALVILRFYRMFVFEQEGRKIYAVADDTYITACFGRTLFAGHGAVWYPGAPRIEGYTSPIWMLIVGALHRVPGFREEHLGLWLLGLNLLLVVAVVAVISALVARRLAASEASPRRIWLALPVMLGGGALCYWATEGYELVLVALCALGALAAATGPLTRRRAIVFGVALALGICTRIDAVVVLLPLCVWAAHQGIKAGRLRELVLAGAVAGTLVVGMFVVRRAYYGAWLPNTYVLKATGWPLADRLSLGFAADGPLIPTVLLVTLPLLSPAVRRMLGDQLGIVATCILAFVLSVLYSVRNGGDAWQLHAGHDRYTTVGSVMLILGLAFVAVRVRARAAVAVPLHLLLAGLVVAPAVVQPGGLAFHQAHLIARNPPPRTLEREWIRYGKRFEQLSEPGARIAVCAAGAIVYFSHRGGVDLLGKVDSTVAHLKATASPPAGAYCWRNRPGHNKEDVAGSFRLQRPEFSRYAPPPEVEGEYAGLLFAEEAFWARKGTPFLRPSAATSPLP